MGLIHAGVPRKLALALKSDANIEYFVETGTFNGESCAWAAGYFEKVKTIEAYQPLFEAAVGRFAPHSNVEVIFGSSIDALPAILSNLRAPALFWLDAHWSGEGTGGEDNECPLVSELEIILKHRTDHILLVDDARFFLAPPHKPLNPEKWPDFELITRKIRTLSPNAYVVVIEDVIVVTPDRQKACIVDLLRDPPPARNSAALCNDTAGKDEVPRSPRWSTLSAFDSANAATFWISLRTFWRRICGQRQ
jgi:hypothetical protein